MDKAYANGEEDLIALSNDVKNVEDVAEAELFPHRVFTISSYGADYTVDLLVKRVEKGDFFVPPFQRAFVWNMRQSSKFIESLLIGLPVPGIFVFRQKESNRHLIVDGQQRLKSLTYFYRGLFHDTDRAFRLADVQPQWDGKTYETLDDADRRRLDDSILHTTIFRQESPEDSDTSVYEVFERINTGGVKLSAQEIRVCVNFGFASSFLRNLNSNGIWRAVYGPKSPRLKDEELILRFLAFLERLHIYRRPLKSFLNDFMKTGISEDNSERFQEIFIQTITLLQQAVGNTVFRPERALNAAVFDCVAVAVARRIQAGVNSIEEVRASYQNLLTDSRFAGLYTGATADEANVQERYSLAFHHFGA